MADDTQLAQELAKARDLASLAEAIFGTLIGGASVLIGMRAWWRRRTKRQAERTAAAAKAARDAEDQRIGELILIALDKFARDVVDPEFTATHNAMKAALEQHAENADARIGEVGLAVARVAATVESCMDRFERTVGSVHARMDDFLGTLAAGQMPHFRALPRPDPQPDR